jgi:hypothetical protein
MSTKAKSKLYNFQPNDRLIWKGEALTGTFIRYEWSQGRQCWLVWAHFNYNTRAMDYYLDEIDVVPDPIMKTPLWQALKE